MSDSSVDSKSPPSASRAEQERSSGRRIVLFFDGTGAAAFLDNVRSNGVLSLSLLQLITQLFRVGKQVTNLPTLFSLVSALPQEQLLYYQAGIGTPIVQSTGFPGFLSRARARIAAVLDDGLAWSLASVRPYIPTVTREHDADSAVPR